MMVFLSFHLFLFCCRLLQVSAEEEHRVINPIATHGPHTHHPAYQHPPTAKPTTKKPTTAKPTTKKPTTKKPTTKPTKKPTKKPTSRPTCAGDFFVAKFSSPSSGGSKGVTGKLEGFYVNKDKAALELKIKFGDFKFNDVKIKEGDLLDWSVNISWDNPGISGWNNKCRAGRTNFHYDPTVACSPLSENIIVYTRRRLEERRLAPKANVPFCIKNNGVTVKAQDYNCKPKKKQQTCERGDLSGKLGQLEVIKDNKNQLLVKFKGTDNFFPRKNVAEKPETDWSIVLSKGGSRFLCAQFILLCN